MAGIRIKCCECGYLSSCSLDNVLTLCCETCGAAIPVADIIKQLEDYKKTEGLTEAEKGNINSLITKLTAVEQMTITSERTGLSLRVPSNTQIGASMLNRLGEKFSEFYSDAQFLITAKDGHWYITHNQWAKNRTIVDGIVISKETELTNGSIVSVGNARGTVTKLPIKITFE